MADEQKKEEKKKVSYADIPMFFVLFSCIMFLSAGLFIFLRLCPTAPSPSELKASSDVLPVVPGSVVRPVPDGGVMAYRSFGDMTTERNALLLASEKCVIVTHTTKDTVSFGMYGHPFSSFVTKKEGIVAVKSASGTRLFFWRWRFLVLALMVCILALFTGRAVINYRKLYDAFYMPLRTLQKEAVPEDQPISSLELEYEQTKTLYQSENTDNIALGIIRADALLDRLLRAHGIVGQTFQDLLRDVPKTLIPDIDELWTARRVRNRIAHEERTSIYEDEMRTTARIYHKTLSRLFDDLKKQKPKPESSSLLPPPPPPSTPRSPTSPTSSTPAPPDNLPI